jgi:two-component system sensor histidine kinase ArlS
MKDQDLVVLADLEHSLRGPIAQAYLRARHLAEGRFAPEEIVAQTRAIMGLCGRARQVLRNIDLIVKLHRHQPIDLNVSRLSPQDVVGALEDAVQDNLAVLPRHQETKILIDSADFDALSSLTVLADLDLLEQAFRAIIDNAIKYSFYGNPIRIIGRIAPSGAFAISVLSRGLKISQEEIPHVAKYGWRGAMAMTTVGSGSGIGLWLVDNIMKAQKGALTVGVTDTNQETIVTLSLPTI